MLSAAHCNPPLGLIVNILGIVTRTHDSGLALLNDGVPTIVLEEERFNREKHTRKFPFRSLKAAFAAKAWVSAISMSSLRRGR